MKLTEEPAMVNRLEVGAGCAEIYGDLPKPGEGREKCVVLFFLYINQNSNARAEVPYCNVRTSFCVVIVTDTCGVNSY